MTTAQVVETSVTVNNNSPIQGYVHLDDQTQPFNNSNNNNNNNNNNNINNKSQQQQRLILKNFGGRYGRTRVKSLPGGLDTKRRRDR